MIFYEKFALIQEKTLNITVLINSNILYRIENKALFFSFC